jgi:tRNA A37 threonylcarbamoyladenosine synthetase subunit TsaC/SUA5/YrdC
LSAISSDREVRFPLFSPPAQLTGESGHKNEDECEREVDEEVVAVHGGTSKE